MMILAACSSGNTMIRCRGLGSSRYRPLVGSESGKTFKGTGRRVKLNAAYAEDGPELLVRTVEHNTGLRIDHYAEIGFAGFANIVDALGGVEIDIEKGFKDKKSGADFQAGGRPSTASSPRLRPHPVRLRGVGPGPALNEPAEVPRRARRPGGHAGHGLNPFRLYPTLGAGLRHADRGRGHASLFDLAEMFFAMKGVNGGDGTSMNMPISGSRGSNLVWDKEKVRQLVQQIQNDEKVTVTSNR